MYFCPCACSKAECENEEDVLICLPRNLSYAGESYLDRYSVSSAYVHNSKLEKQLMQSDAQENYIKAGAAACAEVRRELGEGGGEDSEDDGKGERVLGAGAMAHFETDQVFKNGGPDNCDFMMGDATPTNTTPTTFSLSSPISSSTTILPPQLTVTIDHDKSSSSSSTTITGDAAQAQLLERYVVTESPDSDLVSEEGIFVNMMDDLDGLAGSNRGGKSTLSEASDDTYVSGDSMYYSPVEVEDIDDNLGEDNLRVSLEEALQHATFTLQPHSSSPPPLHNHDNNNDETNHLTLSLPHANDGESKTDAERTIATESTDKNTDHNNHHETSGHSENPPPPPPTTTTPTDRNSEADNKPIASKNPGLGIYLKEIPPPSEDSNRGPHGSSSYHSLLSPSSPLYEDREFNFTRTELRKSTSLKSTKTPPGTPRRKKVVRFADAMGLDLESVRHVLNLESPPKIPPSAMKDLQQGLAEDRKAIGMKYITETFTQPGADVHFRDRVLLEKVVLENALVVSGSITGVVRVSNISFHKTVRVRFTTNAWASFHDIAASYMANSNDGPTDRFAFTLVPPPEFSPGSRLEFAVSYSANGVDYWDNNCGKNYGFECYAKTVPTEAENAWLHFL